MNTNEAPTTSQQVELMAVDAVREFENAMRRAWDTAVSWGLETLSLEMRKPRDVGIGGRVKVVRQTQVGGHIRHFLDPDDGVRRRPQEFEGDTWADSEFSHVHLGDWILVGESDGLVILVKVTR
ncbi:MAG: hypothetical protein EPO52_17225 [Herbiconiux sp.]|uniref:hypothetical protein n=1 Tax=Herbiconiux sp. TaxID=1871186 RepID=UPI00121F35EF|nr:hypothetical protein [Herbiconiux sp.]TAJ46279.1 MAG: hypothetical protein EPO52_17225 [Herbiconiux sp.]